MTKARKCWKRSCHDADGASMRFFLALFGDGNGWKRLYKRCLYARGFTKIYGSTLEQKMAINVITHQVEANEDCFVLHVGVCKCTTGCAASTHDMVWTI